VFSSSISGAVITATSGVIASGTAANPSLSILGDPNTGIYSPGADQVAISTNGTGRLFVDASGNVGVGTVSTSSFQSASSTVLSLRDTATNNIASLKVLGGAGAGAIAEYGATNGIGFCGTSGAHDFTFYTNSNERARIDSSGRLLVGTSSTSSNLRALIQATSANGSGGGNLYLARGEATPADGAGLGYLGFSDSNHGSAAGIEAVRDGGTWTSGSSQPTRLVFSTTSDSTASPTERVRITSAGYFKASNSGSYIALGSNTHEFNNDQNGVPALRVYASNASFNNSVLSSICARTTTNGSIYLVYAANGNASGQFAVLDSGNVQNTNNSYGAISDIKLKENIVDASSQWDDLKALQVRNYNFKEGQTHTQIGLVAQEVELVSPGLVSESPDRDEEGNDLGTVTKSVNYSVLYMKAVKALQEAMERIETLEAKVAALEAL